MNYQDCPKCGVSLVKQETEHGYIAYVCLMCGYSEYDPPGIDLPYKGMCSFCGIKFKGERKSKYCDKHDKPNKRRVHKKRICKVSYKDKTHPWKMGLYRTVPKYYFYKDRPTYTKFN